MCIQISDKNILSSFSVVRCILFHIFFSSKTNAEYCGCVCGKRSPICDSAAPDSLCPVCRIS